MKYLTPLLVLFFLTSCEYPAQLSYKITNHSASTVKIIYTSTNQGVHSGTVLLAPGEQKLVYMNEQGISGVNNYKETGTYLREFTQMDVFKNDTARSVTNFLQTSRWEYHEQNVHAATYLANVYDTDF